MAAERIRVLIAGNIYVKRALVRGFLEDDGYDVIAEALTSSEIQPAIRRGSPDAVVVDDELLEIGSIERIRSVAPDAKVVVFTSTPPSSPSAMIGADAYLEKGVGLAALTALLGRLFEPDRSSLALVGAAAGAGTLSTSGTGGRTDLAGSTANATTETAGALGSGGGPPARLVAVGGGAILIVVGLIAMLTTGGGGTDPAPADTTDQTGGGVVVAQPTEDTELDAAYATLDRLVAAIEGGNYVLATVEAQALMDARESAFAAGFTISGLDAEVTARLEGVVTDIPEGASANLQGILGDLYPVLEDESTPGGGSDVVLGDTVTSDGGPTSGGGTSTDGSGGGVGGGVGGGAGGGGETTQLGPGDGRAWGQWHKENKGSGGPPPWAKGHGNGPK